LQAISSKKPTVAKPEDPNNTMSDSHAGRKYNISDQVTTERQKQITLPAGEAGALMYMPECTLSKLWIWGID
jgi:hypothetical protein